MNKTPSKIAILEDHPMMRDAVAFNLVRYLPDAQIVHKGSSVQELLETTDPTEPPLVILDLDLGDESDPLENIRLISNAGMQVIIVSALAKPQTVKVALRNGAAAFVSKNAEPEALGEAIKATLKGEQYMSPDIAIALLSSDESGNVELSKKEQQALSLYASGMKLEAVARAMEISRSTASEYIQRARKKYTKAGINLPTKTDLYRQAQKDGLLQ